MRCNYHNSHYLGLLKKMSQKKEGEEITIQLGPGNYTIVYILKNDLKRTCIKSQSITTTLYEKDDYTITQKEFRSGIPKGFRIISRFVNPPFDIF